MRDSFCSYCGAAHTAGGYPKTCPRCSTPVWSNPIPVSVVIVPVQEGTRTGVLAIRRKIFPVGTLALPGGFVESHETWQQAGAREVFEEADVKIDPAKLEPLWWASSTPKPDRVLLFSVAPTVDVAALPAFTPNTETSERGLIYGPDGLAAEFGFSTHIEAIERYFARAGVTGPYAFAQR